MEQGKPFGKNIRFKPASKDKIIGDTSKYWLFGEVIAIGDEVGLHTNPILHAFGVKRKGGIKVGDHIEVTQWALNKTIMSDKEERFYVKEDDEFILNVW